MRTSQNQYHKQYQLTWLLLLVCKENHGPGDGTKQGATEQSSVGTGPPVGVGIDSLPVTPKINGEIGAMCVESCLAGVAQHNKT